jgi:hypothetical protein
MTRNFRGCTRRRRRSWRRVFHCDRACTHLLHVPSCISFFGYLKVINVEFGLNDAPVKKRSLAAKN